MQSFNTILNYEEIMAALDLLNEPKSKIFLASKNINSLAMNGCPNWQGSDSKGYRKELMEMSDSINNTIKWLDAVCEELRNRAILLKESEQTFQNRTSIGENYG